MKRRLLCLFVCMPFVLSGCFPTIDDVNALAKADHDFVAGEHQATRDQMTEEHKIQTPESTTLLTQVNADAAAAIQKLRARVNAVEAKGMGVAAFSIDGLWGMLGVMFPGLAGIGLWVRNLLQPSRAAMQVAALETTATATANELTDLKHQLATAADAGEPVPVGGTA